MELGNKKGGKRHEFGKQLISRKKKMRLIAGSSGRKTGGKQADHFQMGSRSFP